MSMLAVVLIISADAMTMWPEKVLAMQRNWIGKSEGARVKFALEEAPGSPKPGDVGSTQIEVFTTRIDTIYGATSVQLAPEHAVAKAFAAEDDARRVQIEEL